MNKGFSLMELVIGIVVAGIVGIGVSRFSSQAMQDQKNTKIRTQTEQRMRAFLESQKKHIVASRNSYPGVGTIINLPFTNRNCSFLLAGAANMGNCGVSSLTFNRLIIDRYLDASNATTYFTETTQTECVAQATGIPSGVNISSQDLAAIRECSPCGANQIPVVRATYSNRPGLVLRYSGAVESPSMALLAGDDTTLASSLCVTHNAVSNPGDPNSFTQLNIRIRTLIRLSDSSRILEYSSAIPTPTAPTGGVRVLSTGR